MSGEQKPGRIEVLTGRPDEAEAAAIVAALYALRPVQAPVSPTVLPSRWKRIARLEAQQRLSEPMETAGRSGRTLWPD